MAERFLPTEDPVLEQVLTWTVERDARDVRRLLEWLPHCLLYTSPSPRD